MSVIDLLGQQLGVTSQQILLLRIIHALQERKQPTTPVNIEKEYIKETKAFIQKSNLFSQLKVLAEKGLILKSERSNYLLNVSGIRDAIKIRKEELGKEMKSLEKFQTETDEFLHQIEQPNRVHVSYLAANDLYSKLAFNLKEARAFYLGCDFPHYAYSFAACTNAQQAAYIEVLNTKLHEDDFSMFCLSTYKTDAIVHTLRSKYGDNNIVQAELKHAHETALEKTAQCKTIDLRKTTTSFDFALIETENGENLLFMFLKDSHHVITGGVFLSSNETVKQIKEHFLSQMRNNPPLKSKEDFLRAEEDITTPPKGAVKKLIAFDVNRVFTVNHTTVELATLAGREHKVGEYIRKQIEGEIGVQEAIEESARLLKGLSVKKIDEFYPKMPLMKNLRLGIKKLKEQGYYIVAISTGFSHIITPLCKELGVDETYCNVLEEKDGKLTGIVTEKNVVTDNVKYYIVKYLLEKFSVPEEKSIGVGDGYSDLDLLKATHMRIAFNPTNSLIKLYEQKSPLITHLIKEKDFMILADEILKNV